MSAAKIKQTSIWQNISRFPYVKCCTKKFLSSFKDFFCTFFVYFRNFFVILHLNYEPTFAVARADYQCLTCLVLQ